VTVADAELADRFEAHRDRLWAVAYCILGSRREAEDAVQESWQRLRRAGGSGTDDLGGWLTTVVARVCLDVLRARARPRVVCALTIVDGRIEAIHMTAKE
jgi:RNA polymerase sigma-70 factor (ECF subfamily)